MKRGSVSVSRGSTAANGQYVPIYGLAAGSVLWIAIFIPVTFGVILHLLNSIDDPAAIRQRVPTGGCRALQQTSSWR